MQCTACEVAYTSGRFCPTCDNKLAAVDQTTFPVVAAPPRVAAGAHAEAPAAPAPAHAEAPAAPAPAAPAPRPPAAIAGTFKVIDPDGAKVYLYWDDLGGSEEVAHLAQGTSVEVTAERGRQVRIVEPRVGCVFLESLERIEPVASAPDASPAAPAPDVEAPAAPAPAPDDTEMAEVVETQEQANARRRVEITAQLDRLKLIDPDTYATVVASFLGVVRGAVEDATRRSIELYFRLRQP